jgi:hypothetical protein
MARGSIRSYVSAPRWASPRELLEQARMMTGVEFEVTERDKGLFTDTVYYKISGEEVDLRRFQAIVARAIARYNAD